MFIVRINSDLTEGRGPMVSRGYYTTIEPAVAHANQPRDMGGSPAAEIIEVTPDTPDAGRRIWGYRKDPNGRYGYGFVDNREFRESDDDDPEYDEYLRLREKFEGS